MAPSLRPVLPLCDFTALRWGSSIILRPRHVFHVQRFLSHVRTSEKKEENESSGWSFPRETMPSWAKMWWIFLHVPSLPIGLMRLIGKSLYQSWTLPVVNSRAARLSYVFRSGCLDLLSEVIRPWGFVGRTEGSSMEPTLPAVPALIYASFAYINKTDVKRGDVVVIPPPKPYDDRAGIICKRIAALEGDRIWVNEYGPPRKVSARRVHVPFGHCFLLGDNARDSCDSRTFGTVPIDTVLAKVQWQWQWGLNGRLRVDHDQHPWLQNKAIEQFLPADDGHPNDEDLTPQPEKIKLKMLRTIDGKPPRLSSLSPPSSAPKKQQKEKKQGTDPRNES